MTENIYFQNILLNICVLLKLQDNHGSESASIVWRRKVGSCVNSRAAQMKEIELTKHLMFVCRSWSSSVRRAFFLHALFDRCSTISSSTTHRVWSKNAQNLNLHNFKTTFSISFCISSISSKASWKICIFSRENHKEGLL